MIEQTATAPDTATKAKPYVCTTCTRPFARLEHLKRHERSHTKEKPFCCEQAGAVAGCGRHFARRDLLLRHQQKIHLFPNTSKRRRLSVASTASAKSASNASVKSIPKSPAEPPAERCVLPVINMDDLTNLSNGTVNPSSIYTSSPPGSVHTTLDHYMEQHLPIVDKHSACISGYTFATEKLFPSDAEMLHEDSLPQIMSWAMPPLSASTGSPTSTDFSDLSPTTSYGSLGRTSSLEMAGSDSAFFSPDFFLETAGALNYQRYDQGTEQRYQFPSQLFISSQLDMMHDSSKPNYNALNANFQFAGGDQAYCYGYRPSNTSGHGTPLHMEMF